MPEELAAVIPVAAALIATLVPVIVGVIAIASTKPFVDMVPVTDPANAGDVSVTVPVNPVAVFPFASRAVIRTLNGVPAVLVPVKAVLPPESVTANCVAEPGASVIAAVFVIAAVSKVPEIVVEPEVVGDV